MLTLLLLLFAMQSVPENPLPECARSTNCERETWVFENATPRDVYRHLERAVKLTGGRFSDRDPDDTTLAARYRVVIFVDNLDAVAVPYEGGTALHVRSASRLGRRDFGINRSRLDRIRAVIDDGLARSR